VPTTYQRDDDRRLITVTVTEHYAVDDILFAIERQSAENAWGYAVLYNLCAPLSMAADAQRIAGQVNAVAQGRARGPVGMAISGQPDESQRDLTDTELIRTIVDVEVLLTPTQVDDWLARHAPLRG
jgi:hypothetical protein